MYDRRGRARRGVWVTAGVATLALAVAAAALLAWPTAQPERPPAWSSPAPRQAAPLLTAATAGSDGQGSDGQGSDRQGAGSGVTEQGLARRLGGLLADARLGSPVGAVVMDAAGGVRYERAGDQPLVPASTLKIVTSAGVLAVLGPDERFTTSTVRGRSRDEVVLVGGGDPTLTRAGRGNRTPGPDQSYSEPARLPDLAKATAARLRHDGVRRVRLSVDDSLFTGPTTHPTWPSGYVTGGSVAPVTALTADAGRVDPDDDSRETDPSLAAGGLFADMLASHGVAVVGGVSRTTAQRGAPTLAQVHSPRLEEIVETTLARSDNDMAEVLLRQTAVAAGRPASFYGGVRATREALESLNVPTSGLDMQDGSGLSRDNLVAASTLAGAVSAAASPRHPELRSIVTGLPVAGFSGTLHFRFGDGGTTDAAGLVRAKTGTLTGVSSLAGITYTGAQGEPGDVLVFAVLANGVGDPLAAEDLLDRVGSALAACGCR